MAAADDDQRHPAVEAYIREIRNRLIFGERMSAELIALIKGNVDAKRTGGAAAREKIGRAFRGRFVARPTRGGS
jgi:hypothetical protein